MKTILYMAITANGMIARENNQEDFLSHENWKVFVKLAESAGCFIIGRKTYEEVKKWEEYNFDSVNARKIIVSRDKGYKPAVGYTTAISPKDALQKASRLSFKRVLLAGGSILNSSFMNEGLIDEIILNIEPYILGKGISLFTSHNFEGKLKLIKATALKRGIVQLHYKVRAP